MTSHDDILGLPPTITGTTKIVGVMGHPVGHSLSPPMHNAAFRALGLDYCYVPFDVRPERVAQALRGLQALGIVGVNVTIPLKGAAFAAMDEVTDHARALGVVNTVVCSPDKLFGDSSDGPGFVRALRDENVDPAGMSIVLLGAGGSAKAIAHALAESRPSRLVVAARRPEQVKEAVDSVLWRFPDAPVIAADLLNPDELVEHCRAADLLVNTTPLGMHPNVDVMPPVPDGAFHPGLTVCDIIYRPLETLLMGKARAAGCRAIGGAGMLVHQGAISFEMWTGVPAPTDVMMHALLAKLRE